MSGVRAQGSAARWLAMAASVVVVATIVVAIMTMGTPSAQRLVRLDQKRVDDLERIVAVVHVYERAHRTLPPDLATLAGQPGQRLSITDPVSGAPYRYEVTGPRRFRLCADFATDTAKPPSESERWMDDEWNHGVGRHCFDRELPATSTAK